MARKRGETMEKNKKVLATFTLTPENKRFIEQGAEKEGRSKSSFLDKLITSMKEKK